MFVLVLFLAGTFAVGSPVSGLTDVSEIVPCVQNDTCTLYPSGCDGNDKLCCYFGLSMNCFCCFSTTTIGVTVTSSLSTARTTTIQHTTNSIQSTSSTEQVESSAAPSSTDSLTKVTFDTTTKVISVEAPSSIVVPIVCSISAVISMALLILAVVLWREPVWRIRFLYFTCACLIKQHRRNSSTADTGFLTRVENWLANLSNEMDRMSDHSDDQTQVTEVGTLHHDQAITSAPSESNSSDSPSERFPDAIEHVD